MDFSISLEALTALMQPTQLILIVLAAILGTLVGAIPGFGPMNCIALLLPILFITDPSPLASMTLLTTLYLGAEYGGRISAILLNIPGDAGAVATTLDGHAMAQHHQALEALLLSAFASFIGGLLALLGFTFFAPLFATMAFHFGFAEKFWIIALALLLVINFLADQPLKTALATLLGMSLTLVGIDLFTGTARYTFDLESLLNGFDLFTLIIGFFAISEILYWISLDTPRMAHIEVKRINMNWLALWKMRWTMVRASVVGFIVGILPGIGASVASTLAYSLEKSYHKNPEPPFGAGQPCGVVAPETANNAAAVGSLVPMLTLGIPGSGTTAIILGALYMLNVRPGPLLFERQAPLVAGLILSLFLANIILLILNSRFIHYFAVVMRIPKAYLAPAIIVFSLATTYALYMDFYQLIWLLIIGVIGYVLRCNGFSLIAIVMGYILGKLLETALRQTLSASNGEWLYMLNSPISIILALIVLGLILKLLIRKRFLLKGAVDVIKR